MQGITSLCRQLLLLLGGGQGKGDTLDNTGNRLGLFLREYS